MSLKSKLIVILLSIFLIYGFVEYFIQRFIIFPSFLNLEKYEATQNLKRSIAAIDREIFHLNTMCKDWTVWDDTYEFMQSHSPKYISSNLNNETFVSNGLNAMFFCDKSGHTLWGKIIDLKSGKEIGNQDLFPGTSEKNYPLIKPGNTSEHLSETYITGILMTSIGPMLISSRPIMTSENKGPSRGYAIFGQFLNDELIDKLVKQTQVNFTIITDSALIKSALNSPSERLDENFSYTIDSTDSNTLHIHTIYKDIMKNPAFLIRTTIPRSIVQNGFSTIRLALISVFLVGLGIMLIITLIMKITIIAPISRLTKHVLTLAETQDYSMRINLNRNDEVGTLAGEFDKMVGKIEDQTKDLISMNDSLINDISKRMKVEKALQEANQELDKLARFDGLTKIANRRQFDECINLEWRRMMREKMSLSLILCDVDFFKLFNDTYGHQAGDECLKSIAQVIKNNARRPSDFPARYGGEEFALILPNTNSQGAAGIAELIRSGVQELSIPHRSSSVAETVTITLGISSLVPDDSLSVDDLIDLADRALYEAKNQGRNRFVLKVPMAGL